MSVCIALLIMDRAIFGPEAVRGWLKTTQITGIPEKAGHLMMPPYFPDTVEWPPSEIWYRTAPSPGWWAGLKDKQSGEIWLWLGTGVVPRPAALSVFENCFDETTMDSCPQGWRIASTQVAGQTLYVLTRLSAQETKRILIGFGLPSS